MLIELLRNALGPAPMGFEFFEYIFSFFLLMLGLLFVYLIFNIFFSMFKKR